MLTLHTLPYDLLLNIALYLNLRDVHALQLVSLIIFGAKVRIGHQKKAFGDWIQDGLRSCSLEKGFCLVLCQFVWERC